MKFCPECGSGLPIGTAKFCPNCGKSLWGILSDTLSEPVSSSFRLNQGEEEDVQQNNLFGDTRGQDDDIGNKQENITVHMKGTKLEELVERILKGNGFSTKRRQKLVGIDGVTHEIDVLGSRGRELLAVECKNYERCVGIKEIRDFKSKLDALPHIKSALFVTYSKFSSDMKNYASNHKIDLWDGDRLGRIYLSMLIGRQASSSFQTFVFEFALPVATSYEKVANLNNLVNAHSTARISKATLFFHPYYVFEYKLDLEKHDHTGKNHRIKAEGIHIVDAVDENILQKTNREISRSHRHAFLSKNEKHPSDYEQVLKNVEQDLIIRDLTTIRPEYRYKIEETADYSITKLDYKVPFKVTRDMVKEKVVEDNTREVSYKLKLSKDKTEERKMTIIPKHDDVRIKKSSLIYVPKWEISIESKTTSYVRKILAASKATLVDEIAQCPKDFSVIKIWVKPQSTYALCEICGRAFCLDHIFNGNESRYYCEEHNDNI